MGIGGRLEALLVVPLELVPALAAGEQRLIEEIGALVLRVVLQRFAEQFLVETVLGVSMWMIRAARRSMRAAVEASIRLASVERRSTSSIQLSAS